MAETISSLSIMDLLLESKQANYHKYKQNQIIKEKNKQNEIEKQKIIKQIEILNEYLNILKYLDEFSVKSINNWLQQEINDILASISNFEIIISDKFMIKQNSNIIPAKQASGFQKFAVEVAIHLCIAKITNNLLIIDEGFGCMDHEHLNNTKHFIKSLNQNIIIISHLEELHGTEKMTITQKSGKSYISYEPMDIKTDYNITDDSYCEVCKKHIKSINMKKHLSSKLHLNKM